MQVLRPYLFSITFLRRCRNSSFEFAFFSPISPEAKGVLSRLEVRSAQHQISNRDSAEWCAEAPGSHVRPLPAVAPTSLLRVSAWTEPQQASRPGRRFLQKATWPGGFPRSQVGKITSRMITCPGAFAKTRVGTCCQHALLS